MKQTNTQNLSVAVTADFHAWGFLGLLHRLSAHSALLKDGVWVRLAWQLLCHMEKSPHGPLAPGSRLG